MSRGSITNEGEFGYPSPVVPADCNVRLPRRGLDGEVQTYPLTDIPIVLPYLSSGLVPHLAACRYHSGSLPPLVLPPRMYYTCLLYTSDAADE